MEISSLFSLPEVVWFIIGLVLFLVELFVLPGLIVLFFGIGAWVTSLVCLLSHPGLNAQLVIFSIVSIISLLALRKLIQKKFFEGALGKRRSNRPELEDEFVNQIVEAASDFSKGQAGKVVFKGAIWEAYSDAEVKKGDRLKIVKFESIKLFVAPIASKA